jgi:hypothetical protein
VSTAVPPGCPWMVRDRMINCRGGDGHRVVADAHNDQLPVGGEAVQGRDHGGRIGRRGEHHARSAESPQFGGADQDETAYRAPPVKSHLLGDQTAHGMSEEVDVAQAQGLDEGDRVGGGGLGGVRGGPAGGRDTGVVETDQKLIYRPVCSHKLDGSVYRVKQGCRGDHPRAHQGNPRRPQASFTAMNRARRTRLTGENKESVGDENVTTPVTPTTATCRRTASRPYSAIPPI